MQFSRTFIVEDSEPMVHHQLGLLLREAGYVLMPDGYYQRGSREDSMESLDPSGWFTLIQADTHSTPEFYTQVDLSYDVQTNGQSLKYHIRQFWVDEVNQFAAKLGASYDSAQERLTKNLGLDIIPPVEKTGSAADSFVNPILPKTLTPAKSPLRYTYEQRQKNGANWFFWIAGLSVLNSTIYLLDAKFDFVFGLGVTQVLAGTASALMDEFPASTALWQVGSLLINLVILAIFAGFGLVARRGKGWAFILGMSLYLLDGLVFLLVENWFAILFHGIAFYGLLRGYLACRALQKIVRKPQVISPT